MGHKFRGKIALTAIIGAIAVSVVAATPAQALIANSTLPVITGTANPGQTLTCSDGTWTVTPSFLVKAWLLDGTTYLAAGNTYMVLPSQIGHQLTCRVNAVKTPDAAGTIYGQASASSAARTIDSLPPQPPGTPPVTPPAVLPPGRSLIETPSARGWCGSRRNFQIRVRQVKGVEYKTVKVFVNGKRIRVVKTDRYRATVNLRKFPFATIKAKIAVTTTDGRSMTGHRKYHTCRQKRLPGRKHKL